MCEEEGTRGPWRRGATACCRLSRQLLARYGSTVACVSLFVSFVALVSMGLKFMTVPILEVFLTDLERCAKAGSLSMKSRVFWSRHIAGYLLARWGSTPHCATLSGSRFCVVGLHEARIRPFARTLQSTILLEVYVLSQFAAVSFASQLL